MLIEPAVAAFSLTRCAVLLAVGLSITASGTAAYFCGVGRLGLFIGLFATPRIITAAVADFSNKRW